MVARLEIAYVLQLSDNIRFHRKPDKGVIVPAYFHQPRPRDREEIALLTRAAITLELIICVGMMGELTLNEAAEWYDEVNHPARYRELGAQTGEQFCQLPVDYFLEPQP